MGLERARRGWTGGPKAKLALGQPLLSIEVSLAIIDQDLDRSPAPGSKDEYATRERVLGQLLSANLSQAINAFAAVDRLDGHQDLHLRSELQHQSRTSRRMDPTA
jgi:hypothetical protein